MIDAKFYVNAVGYLWLAGKKGMTMDEPLLVKQTKFERGPGSNDANVSFTSASGETVTLSFSPIAQSQLLTMLLSSAKGRKVGNDFELTRPAIRVHSFAPFLQSDELAGLEIGVQTDTVVHVCFDFATFQQLGAAVNELASPRKGAPSSEAKH